QHDPEADDPPEDDAIGVGELGLKLLRGRRIGQAGEEDDARELARRLVHLEAEAGRQENRHHDDRCRVAKLQPDVEQVVAHLALVSRPRCGCFARGHDTLPLRMSCGSIFIYPPCDLKKCPRSSASCPADASRQSWRALSLSRGREPDCTLAPALVQLMMLLVGQRATITLTSQFVSEAPPPITSSSLVMLPSMKNPCIPVLAKLC